MYPTTVDIKDKTLEKLTRTLRTAYQAIVGEISDATDFGVKNRKAILAQIERMLRDLGDDFDTFIKKEITDQYKIGAEDAISQLRNIGAQVNVSEGFNRVHLEAIAALVDDTSRAFAESMVGVKRSANLLLGKATRELITQKMAEGAIGGKALREVRQTIKGILQEQGLSALKDKAGHTWSLDRYSEMLFRTKVVEARNRGLANRLVENGNDLVQVSSHANSCPLCSPWQGKILSLTGKTDGYPTVSEAEADGLFHPNCRHAINTLIPSLARKTSAYDFKTGRYSTPE